MKKELDYFIFFHLASWFFFTTGLPLSIIFIVLNIIIEFIYLIIYSIKLITWINQSLQNKNPPQIPIYHTIFFIYLFILYVLLSYIIYLLVTEPFNFLS